VSLYLSQSEQHVDDRFAAPVIFVFGLYKVVMVRVMQTLGGSPLTASFAAGY
jgi:hypothetical protein